MGRIVLVCDPGGTPVASTALVTCRGEARILAKALSGGTVGAKLQLTL
jgi:hypothetical protein